MPVAEIPIRQKQVAESDEHHIRGEMLSIIEASLTENNHVKSEIYGTAIIATIFPLLRVNLFTFSALLIVEI